MPLRNDSSLWYNMAGVVAAYQPVRAPGSLLARYNMANGGQNAYRAEPGVLPTWSGTAGLTFDGSTQYVSCGIVPFTETWTAIVRFGNLTNNGMLFGTMTSGGTHLVGMRPYWAAFTVRVYYNFALEQNGLTGAQNTGVMGIAGSTCYLNGVADGTIPNMTTWTANRPMMIGAFSLPDSTPSGFLAGDVLAFVLVDRILSPSEMWLASQQMAYCHVNPAWSVWSRHRRWYYGPAVAAAYARRIPDVGRIGSRGVG